jgi:hypothetical protein
MEKGIGTLPRWLIACFPHNVLLQDLTPFLPPRLREIMIERFGRTELVLGEFVPSPDGKHRYFRHIREEMYREITASFREYFGERIVEKIQLAMEPDYVWRNVGV